MTYLELIKKFWKYTETEKLPHSVIAVYLLMLEEWNNNNQTHFSLSDKIISERLNIARRTLGTIRTKLDILGLIKIKITKGYGYSYQIVQDYSFTEKKETLPQKEKPNAEDKSKPLEIPKVEIPKTTTEPPKVETPLQKETEIPKVEVPIHKESQKELPKGIPTLEEFLAYAKTVEIYQPDLDFQIKTKYEKWHDDGWKTGFGKPIKNWQLTLKGAMSYMNKSNTFQGNIPQIKAPKMTYNE